MEENSLSVDKDQVIPEVKVLSEKEKKNAIDKMEIDKRNKNAEEQSRVQGFIKELNLPALEKKWNCKLFAKFEFIGVEGNIKQRIDFAVQANASGVVEIKKEDNGSVQEIE